MKTINTQTNPQLTLQHSQKSREQTKRSLPATVERKIGASSYALIVSLLIIAPVRIASASTVTLTPGANIQAAINSNPAGTTFYLAPGVYRMQSLVPLNGDIFIGQTGATLNGSTLVTNWTKSGSYWVSSGHQPVKTPPNKFSCQSPQAACTYPQDLFLNNKPLSHQLSLPISSGQWYFDYAHGLIYMADNPSGQTVELSVTPRAFMGKANNVKIQNLVIEKYASPLITAAVQPTGSGWIIQNNEVRFNHGEGIKTQGNNEQVLSNKVDNNGEEGMCAGGGSGDLFEYNNVYNNNFTHVAFGIEMGGGKFSATTNAQVINNTFSNNDGNGIWFDEQSYGSVARGNTVTHNTKDGIRCEYSHHCLISNNVLTYNTQNQTTGTCTPNGREITITASDYATVSGNTITSNCSGIFVGGQQQNEAVLPIGIVVTDNTITYSGSTVIYERIGGADGTLGSSSPLFNPKDGSYFDYNTYHFKSTSMLNLTNWVWGGTAGQPYWKNWSQWRAAGQDTHGSAD